MRIARPTLEQCAYLFILPVCGAAVFLTWFRFNLTPSEPVGIYVYDDRARLVTYCPDGTWRRLANERGYRPYGFCSDHRAPLLKQAAATQGDTVDYSPRGISINGHVLPNTIPLTRDQAGRPLAHYPFGHYPVKQQEVWLVSTYDPRSFDSRYFGPVPSAAIRRGWAPLITF